MVKLSIKMYKPISESDLRSRSLVRVHRLLSFLRLAPFFPHPFMFSFEPQQAWSGGQHQPKFFCLLACAWLYQSTAQARDCKTEHGKGGRISPQCPPVGTRLCPVLSHSVPHKIVVLLAATCRPERLRFKLAFDFNCSEHRIHLHFIQMLCNQPGGCFVQLVFVIWCTEDASEQTHRGRLFHSGHIATQSVHTVHKAHTDK